MSVTILEALENADYNMQNNGVLGASLAKNQLHNAFILLQKGYELHEKVEPIIEKYGSVEEAPDKN